MNKQELEQLVKESITLKECLIKLGLHSTSSNSYKKLNYFISLYEIDISHFKKGGIDSVKRHKLPLDDILNGLHPLYDSNKLKKRLIKLKYFERCCDTCKLFMWNDLPIPLALDHKDGNSTNHALQNLRLLCPNCHAQTANFCGKNIKFKPVKKNKSTEKDLHRIKLINECDIDLSVYGWVTKLAKVLDMKPQKVGNWVKNKMPDFYNERCYKRV